MRNIDQLQIHISIHALLTESDLVHAIRQYKLIKFLSTLSLRRATVLALGIPTSVSFLSTLSLRRATDKCCRLAACHPVISIHALLTESDWTDNNQTNSKVHFYPRSPYGERPLIVVLLCHHISKFLSTLSLRRATILPPVDTSSVSISIHALLTESDVESRSNILITSKYFYPRSPYGERRSAWVSEFPQLFISIHALLTESDSAVIVDNGRLPIFLSTLSLRRATPSTSIPKPGKVISIHALLTESDTHRILLQRSAN